MLVLCLALGWVLAEGHAHSKPAMSQNWVFLPPVPVMQEDGGRLQLWWWMCAPWLLSVPRSLSSPLHFPFGELKGHLGSLLRT